MTFTDHIKQKVLTLDSSKEYIILVGKESGLSAKDLAQVVVDHQRVIFLMINDVNQIQMMELAEFEVFLEHHKNKK